MTILLQAELRSAGGCQMWTSDQVQFLPYNDFDPDDYPGDVFADPPPLLQVREAPAQEEERQGGRSRHQEGIDWSGWFTIT